MQISENYELEEFVSEQIYNTYQSKALWFLDRRIIYFTEYMSKKWKTFFVLNTWHYTEENLKVLNQKYGTNYDLKNRLQYRGFRESAQCSVQHSAQCSVHRTTQRTEILYKKKYHNTIAVNSQQSTVNS